MSTYQDLITVIRRLLPGTRIEITEEWCDQYGLVVDARIVKVWGRQFHQDYTGLGVQCLGKSSDNLHHYEKI